MLYPETLDKASKNTGSHSHQKGATTTKNRQKKILIKELSNQISNQINMTVQNQREKVHDFKF